MPGAITLREDFSAGDLRALARRSQDTRQCRRLLALAAVAEGRGRAEAAAIGGMDRQTLRDWVHRFNDEGPEGLLDRKSDGRSAAEADGCAESSAGGDRRALLCAQPRSRRHAPDMAARARERAQAIPAPCRRPQSESPDAQTDRRRHPAGGRGGRIWLYLRAYCASWSRSGRSDGPHRLGGWRNRLRRVMFRRRVKPGQ